MHFAPKDIDRLEFQSRCILRSGAVPSIRVPNPMLSNKESTNEVNSTNGYGNIVVKNEFEMIDVSENSIQWDAAFVNMNAFDNLEAHSPTSNKEIATIEAEDILSQEVQLSPNKSNEGNKQSYPHTIFRDLLRENQRRLQSSSL